MDQARMRNYNTFVVREGSILTAFEKFEHIRFVHLLKTPEHKIIVELPRYGLRFIQDDTSHLASTNYRGYVLDENQLMHDGLAPFRRHLVLKDATKDCTRAQRHMLVPVCDVVDSYASLDGRMVDVRVSDEAAPSIDVAVVDEHPRFKMLTTESVETHLQLASLYAACGTKVPSSYLQITGGEAALQLARGCSPTRPFSKAAVDYLQTLSTLTWLTPALKLKVVGLLEESQRLSFLFTDDDGTHKASFSPSYRHALDEYAAFCMKDPSRVNMLRQRLTRSEVSELVGASSLSHAIPYTRFDGNVELEALPISRRAVSIHEERMSQWVTISGMRQQDATIVPAFPLQNSGSNKMGQDMLSELELSWRTHHENPACTLVRESEDDDGVAALVPHLKEMLFQVKLEQEQMWAYLTDSIHRARNNWRDQLLATIHDTFNLSMIDVVRSALDADTLRIIAPRLHPTSRNKFHEAALLLMELYVLEDKLSRLLQRAVAWVEVTSATNDPITTAFRSTQYFVDELSSSRKWGTSDHPVWLAFEVEGRLQIRPEQYEVAQHIIRGTDSICQLNMGRCKTRVILPMVLLCFCRYGNEGPLSHLSRYDKDGDFPRLTGYENQRLSSLLFDQNTTSPRSRLVRTHFLTPLLSETRQFMHRVLTAGVLQLPFIEQPFERHTKLGHHELLCMQAAIQDITRRGGFQMIAPEHRSSLELKRLEMDPELALDDESATDDGSSEDEGSDDGSSSDGNSHGESMTRPHLQRWMNCLIRVSTLTSLTKVMPCYITPIISCMLWALRMLFTVILSDGLRLKRCCEY